MRIACIYLPSLPLQVFLRNAPANIGAPVACLGRDATKLKGAVLTCSRAAWNAGVRPGMHAMAARELCADLIVVAGDAERVAIERRTLRAVGDALLALGARVDVGGDAGGAHHAIYVEVPVRTRGTSFGAKLAEAIAAQGLRPRIGIADDRFTAWVAASTGDQEVVSVPRGGSAAFLSPQPLSLLAISAEVQGVLAALGVRTLGEFAALPPPSVHARAWDADYQALARGDGGVALIAHVPSGTIVERVHLGVRTDAVGGAGAAEVGVGAALGLVARRVSARLAGRGRAAAALQVRTGARVLDVPLQAPLADAADLSDVIGRAIHEGGAASYVELEVTVEVPSEGTRQTAIPAAIPAESSAPIHAAEPATFQLTSPAAPIPMRARFDEPHRTRRGKQRTRPVTAQSRLFR